MLRVHLRQAMKPEHLAELRRSLDPRIELGTSAQTYPGEFDILVDGEPSREDLTRNPRLRAVIVPWVGVPLRTLALMREFAHIELHNLPYNIAPTAEMAVALLLAAVKRIVPYDRHFRHGYWSAPQPDVPGSVLLEGKTALILGYGRIGRRIGQACRSLGMRVVGIRRNPEPGQTEEVGIEDLPRLLPTAGALVICLPHTHETTGLVGARELVLLPRDAVLVNVARGAIVDEEALYRALRERRIYAAGLDVWYRYPTTAERAANQPVLPSAFPFHELDNVVMSPHRAGWSEEKEPARIRELAKLLNAAARGEPIPYRVDPVRGY